MTRVAPYYASTVNSEKPPDYKDPAVLKQALADLKTVLGPDDKRPPPSRYGSKGEHVRALLGEQPGELRLLARFQDQDAVAVEPVSHDSL